MQKFLDIAKATTQHAIAILIITLIDIVDILLFTILSIAYYIIVCYTPFITINDKYK